MKREAIATHLVGGFLGAGKTTFILERLKEEGARIAVLVNEFGTLGIDGELIRAQGGLDVVEMPGGCICCSQKQGLLQTIHQIAGEIAPELLLIEPSGVAETSELLTVLADETLAGIISLDAVITVIDAETFLEFSEPEAFGLFFLDQVQNADLILVNKADLVDEAILRAIEKRIAELAPGAVALTTSFCRMECAIAEAPQRERILSPRAPLGIESVSVVPWAMSQDTLSGFLAEIASGSFGRVLRGKGLLEILGRGWINLQIASGKAAVEDLASATLPRLTLIGFDLKHEDVASYLRAQGRHP